MTAAFDAVNIETRLQIMDCLARYSWALDEGNIDDYLDCFDESGSFRHPNRDGSPGVFSGREAIRAFFKDFEGRPNQTYGHQHQFNAVRMSPHPQGVRLNCYIMVFRHEFHRQYWPRSPSWRMGTWHALFRRVGDDWKILDLDIRMWTDTAFSSGTALVNRGPGMPGTRD